MNQRQRSFAEHYVLGEPGVKGNGTESAKAAGYAAEWAHVTASKLLRNAKVAAYVEKLRADQLERLEVDADAIVAELARIGFADIRELVSWSPDSVRFVPSDSIDDDTAHGVHSVKAKITRRVDEDGETAWEDIHLEVKLHDKVAALRELGRHFGVAETIQHRFLNPARLEIVTTIVDPKKDGPE